MNKYNINYTTIYDSNNKIITRDNGSQFLNSSKYYIASVLKEYPDFHAELRVHHVCIVTDSAEAKKVKEEFESKYTYTKSEWYFNNVINKPMVSTKDVKVYLVPSLNSCNGDFSKIQKVLDTIVDD